MGEDEFAKMSNRGRVIEGGGRTYVTNPATPDAYPAGKGIFAEFNVPQGSVASLPPHLRSDQGVLARWLDRSHQGSERDDEEG
jgi:hypothetical protein